MSEFLYCEHKKAVNPFHHETMSVRVYSLEELVCYIEENLFLLDTGLVGETLFQWMETEIDAADLAASLRKKRDPFDRVAALFAGCGYYCDRELQTLSELLINMQDKTAMERRKMRGDCFLENQKYRMAAYNYIELLQPEHTAMMTEELQGNIWHNLGVAYARLFLYEEAAACFSRSYQLRKDKRSRDAYLYAMNYVSDTYPMEEAEMDLNFTVMREALGRLDEVTQDPSFYKTRKEATDVAAAFDWKASQTGLVTRWRQAYENMTS